MPDYFTGNNKNLCCGCRSCEQACPLRCIKMCEDMEGFLYPVVDLDTCSECGICRAVCPVKDGGYRNTSAFEAPHVYALYHKDEGIRALSTSGGAFSAFVSAFCDDNYAIFGAGFDDNFIVRHSYVCNKNDIDRFRTSKYVQSDTGNSYLEVRKFLNQGGKVLYSGTPCQTAGLKAFLEKDYENLLCIEIICHGVPSPKIFEKYKEHIKKKHAGNIKQIIFRDKSKQGWEPSYMTVLFDNGTKLMCPVHDDDFNIGFYKKYFQRPICHVCPFARIPRVSDITIGDYWGVEENKPHLDDNKGMSLVLVNTLKGKNVFDKAQSIVYTETADLKDAARFNPQLERPAEPNKLREKFMADAEIMDFAALKSKYLKPRNPIRRILSRVINKSTKRWIRRIIKN